MNDYCFSIFWDEDDEHGEPKIIQAETRDDAWSQMCGYVCGARDERGLRRLNSPSHIQLDMVRHSNDNRHKTCYDCGGALGPNPIRAEGVYWHDVCWDGYSELVRNEKE